MIRRACTRAAVAMAIAAAACSDGAEGDRAPDPRVDSTAPRAGTLAPSAPGSADVLDGAPRFRFVDIAKESGITAITWCGRPEKPHLLESGGSGIALVDVDGDGDLDAYVVSAWRLAGAEIVEKTPNRLYRNRGDGTFDDVTEAAGVGDTGWGQGIAAGDADGDGDVDLFVSNFGPDVLYLNRGDGTFDTAPDPPGIDGWSAGAAFFDADGDGDLDLFVAAYVDSTVGEVLHAQATLDWKGAKVMLGPFGLEGKANRFFRNVGGGKFEDATDAAGLRDVGLYYSFAVAALDVDEDRDLDLYVANDSNPNYLYRNEGAGRFREVGLWSGAALSVSGAAQAGMGIARGDFQGDGKVDLLVTNFAEDACALYANHGRCLFADVAAPTGIAAATYQWLSWGCAFADLDLDGDEDLFIANGHIYPQADTAPQTNTSFRQRNLLLENTGGSFRDVSADAGPGLAVVEASHGLACGDVDGDGDLDLLISNVDAAPTLLRNDSPRAGAWLMVDAPGALRVTVEAGGRTQVRDYVAGGSFCSVSDPRFHFGVGDVAKADRVVVRWREGPDTELAGVEAGRVLRVDRGR